MTVENTGHWRWRACALGAAVLALAGCGGGQGTEDGATMAANSSGAGTTTGTATGASSGGTSGGANGTTTTTQTAVAYAAQRPAPVPGTAVLSADGQQALVDAGVALALAEFQPAYERSYGNLLVAPPLLQALRQTVTAAAAGETLAAWQTAFPALTPPELAAAGTAAVSRQLWAQRGHRFETAFLAATDGSGLPSRLRAWSAAETGFADATAGSDAALGASLAAAMPALTWSALAWDDATQLRLVVADALDATLAWPAQPVVDGVFRDAYDRLSIVPMLRLSTGVLRHQGADFVADSLTVAGRSLLMIRPDTTNPNAFARTRLAPALAEALAALRGPGAASAAAGELLLPVTSLAVEHSVTKLAGAGSTAVAYSQRNANFQALDGGGSYLQTRAPSAALTLAPDGLRLQAAALTAFTFSPDNVNNPSYGVVGQDVTAPITFPPACPASAPELRSFFLALIDAQQGLLALVVVAQPDGVLCH